MPSRPSHASGLGTALLALALLAAAVPALASSVVHRNLAELIELSQGILVGEVLHTSDGFANGAPFTEVTLRVEDSLRGDHGGQYTFRQFGLKAPRQMPDGRTALAVTPEGWPRFAAGQRVLLFLYREARDTGLRTTVGLQQGSFEIVGGRIANPLGNAGLFHELRVEPGLLDPAEEQMLRQPSGPADAGVFVSLVRKAVDGRWVEQGRMSRAQ